ncbi:hypothetical protein [Legionella maceachernii]|uniref:hypothetical protein n=1 Tax=Legionella maceachernii TaxID=466 RepID=UPI001F1D0C39|nr:hypothetical protein [Legionella maceachernii]
MPAGIKCGSRCNFIFLPEGHDPDSLVREEGKEKFQERLKNATPLNRFFLDNIASGIDVFTVAGKSQLINAAKPYLLKMAEGPYKQLLLNELSRMTHIETYRVAQILYDNHQQKKQESNKKLQTPPFASQSLC